MNKAYDYAKWCIVESNTDVPMYVKKQCQIFIDICDGKSDKYILNENKVTVIEQIMKLLIMPKGLKAGQSMYECSLGYQWLYWIATLCIVYRDDVHHRRYETGLLEICRKNFKTYTLAILFILLFLSEPQFSKFYSVAPDGALSKELKSAIEETLKASPKVYKCKDKERFTIRRDYIKFDMNEITYYPLNYSQNRFDGKLPNAFLADEVGALPNNYPIEAMQSGQINIKNKFGGIISTKYPTAFNPFEDEVRYAKQILDGIVEDETVFALLFEPDDTKDWMTNDIIIKQSNPASLEIQEIWDDLIKKRSRAILMESARENYLTKHNNIIYQGQGTESYIDVADLRKCQQTNIDWSDRQIYVGVDLSMTNDNCSVSIAAEEDGIIYADSYAFIPEGRIEEKSVSEKVDYKELIASGKCIACGDRTVDYSVIEKFVFDLPKKLKCNIVSLGYDRYNALSSAQKWANDEKNPITCVQIRQHSDTLHSPTKLLEEKILNQQFAYENNKMLEINFQNAKCTYDTNMNRYVNKKKSNGKIDMVASLINAVCLMQRDVIFNDNFVAQYF